MLHAVAHLQGSVIRLLSEEPVSKDPGPILPELKELYWGGGAFVVVVQNSSQSISDWMKAAFSLRYDVPSLNLSISESCRTPPS